MPAYLKFFSFERAPFEGEDAAKVVLGTRAVREALTAIEEGLQEGAARICVSGESGLGKTSLARALPKLLGPGRRVAMVPEAGGATWESIGPRIARGWKLPQGGLSRSALLEARGEQQLVLVLDEAEKASQDLLDRLDVLLSYLDADAQPLVQCILFAQLGAAASSDPPPLVWWLDRIQTHQLAFEPLRPEGVQAYIEKHLARAGWSGDALFETDAAEAIHAYTGGIPGEVGRVCEQLLGAAANEQRSRIDAAFVHSELDAGLDPDALYSSEFEELIAEEEFGGAETEAKPDAPSAEDEDAEAREVAALLDETLARFQSAPPGPPAAAASSVALFPPEDVLDAAGASNEPAFEAPSAQGFPFRLLAWPLPARIAAAGIAAAVLAVWLLWPAPDAETPAPGLAIPARGEQAMRVPDNKPAQAPAQLKNGQTPPILARMLGPVPQPPGQAGAGPRPKPVARIERPIQQPIQIPDSQPGAP